MDGKSFDELVWYASEIYGKVNIKYSSNREIMFISTPWDNFKIFLKDKERFGEYTVYHQNKHKHCDDINYGWHRQRTCFTLDFAVFVCVVHGFQKEFNLPFDHGDFKRFKKDAERAYNYKGVI